MSDFKGTKGECKIIDKSSELECTIYSDIKRICDVKSFGSDFTSIGSDYKKYYEPSIEERIANAKLIACAPEMLKMLTKILEINKHHNFNGHLINEQIEQLIKKATS